MSSERITRSERSELLSLIRKRERVMRAQAVKRSADLLADFDAQSARIYSYDDDVVWAGVMADAKAAVDKAKAEIARRCRQKGIPPEFAPTIEIAWFGRGHNAVASRRAEIRRAARSRIEAMEAQAVAEIERLSLQAQTELLSVGLEGDAARQFLGAMPSMEAMMPTLEVADVEKLIAVKHGGGTPLLH